MSSVPCASSVRFTPLGYSGAGGRFAAICGMPVLPIGGAIGCDGRAATGSQIASPSSRVLHAISGLVTCNSEMQSVLPLPLWERAGEGDY